MTTRLTIAVLAVVTLLTTGCATIHAQQAEQARYQRMADEVTAAYHVASIYVRPIAGYNGQYKCRENILEIGTDATPFLLAHELGHYVLGHGCTESLATEEAANAFAVRALTVWGYGTKEAATMAVRALLNAQRLHVSLPAHDFCAEASEILRLYPEATPSSTPCSTAAR